MIWEDVRVLVIGGNFENEIDICYLGKRFINGERELRGNREYYFFSILRFVCFFLSLEV